MYLSFAVCTHAHLHNDKHSDLNVNEWAVLGGGGMEFFPITSFLMLTDKLHTDMLFRDVAEIETLDNERSNIVNY